MSKQKLTGEQLAAQVKRLKGRFPKFEALSRRKKNFTQGERQSIYFAMRAVEIMEKNTAPERRALAESGEIPAYFADYKYPRDRRKSDKELKEAAKRLIPFATPETKETLRKIAKARGKLKPAQRGVMAKKIKAIPYTESLIPLKKSDAQKLPQSAVRGKGVNQDIEGTGLYAIRLKGHKAKDIANLRVKNQILMFEEKEKGPKGKKRFWYYVPIPFDLRQGEEVFFAKYEDAARYWFDQGAHSVQFWTNNGAAGDAYASARLFSRDLRGRYFEYLSENERGEPRDAYGEDENWILGLVVMFRR